MTVQVPIGISDFRDLLPQLPVRCLQGQPHLFRGVLTGVLRVAKESVFSGLNNVEVHGLLTPAYSTAFGFTEPEVAVLAPFSAFDTGRPEPERVYKAFVLGLLVDLGRDHEVRSEAESGYGRTDLLVRPRQGGRAGAVLELQRLRAAAGETVDQALESALGQIAARRYVQSLEAAGASPVIAWGVVFDGKRVWVRRA
jgi:hypothetical protein